MATCKLRTMDREFARQRCGASPHGDAAGIRPRERANPGKVCPRARKYFLAPATSWDTPTRLRVFVVRGSPAVLQSRGDFGVVTAPRIGMEGPVALVAEVVDAERRGPVPGELVSHSRVGDEEAARSGEARAMRIGVVELVVLQAAVARAQRRAEAVAGTPGRERVRAPVGNARLAFADAQGKVVVVADTRVRPGDARLYFDGFQDLRAGDDLEPAREHAADVLHGR